MKWIDETSYSRGERGTAEPRVWACEVAGLRISVHRYHGLDGWYGTCHGLNESQRTLSAADIATARTEFVAYLMAKVHRIEVGLRKVCP